MFIKLAYLPLKLRFASKSLFYSSQTCKNSSEKHPVLLLTFFPFVSKIGAIRTSKPFTNIEVKIVVT